MNRLHQRKKCPEGEVAHAGKAGFKHNGKGAQLQRQNTSQNRSQDDPFPHGGSPLSEQAASHNGAPDQVIPHKTAVKGHIPDIRSQRHKPAVGEEQALDGENHNHGQKAGLGAEKCRQQHTAAHMPGRSRPRNRIVDHLSRKNKSCGNRHCRQLLRIIVRFQLKE